MRVAPGPARGTAEDRPWDVAVVGAGPAGAAAARSAARTGARVLLLERAQVPRYKRCGGGLIGPSQLALRSAGIDPAALARDSVGRVRFTCDGARGFSRSAAPFLPLVLRSQLDEALVGAAVAAGAELRTGVTVTAYDVRDDGVTLTTSAGPVRARAVVGADGAQSRAAAQVGVRLGQVDLGLEAEVPLPAPGPPTGPAASCSTGARCRGPTAGSSPRGTRSPSASSAPATAARRCGTTTRRSWPGSAWTGPRRCTTAAR